MAAEEQRPQRTRIWTAEQLRQWLLQFPGDYPVRMASAKGNAVPFTGTTVDANNGQTVHRIILFCEDLKK